MTPDWLAQEIQNAFQVFQDSLLAAVKRAAVDALQPTSSTATVALRRTAGASSNGLHVPARALSAALAKSLTLR